MCARPHFLLNKALKPKYFLIWGYFSLFFSMLEVLGTIFATLRASPSGRCLFCEFPTCQNCHNRRPKDKGIVPLKDKEADKDGEPIWYCGYPACNNARPRECANTKSAACKGKLQPVSAFIIRSNGNRNEVCKLCHPSAPSVTCYIKAKKPFK